MKPAVLLAALLLSAPAYAADDSDLEDALEIAATAIPACKRGEYPDGRKVSGEERVEACIRAIDAIETLSRYDHCFSRIDDDWRPCE